MTAKEREEQARLEDEAERFANTRLRMVNGLISAAQLIPLHKEIKPVKPERGFFGSNPVHEERAIAAYEKACQEHEGVQAMFSKNLAETKSELIDGIMTMARLWVLRCWETEKLMGDLADSERRRLDRVDEVENLRKRLEQCTCGVSGAPDDVPSTDEAK